MKIWTRYLGILAVLTLVITAGMAVLNFAVDPYGIYHYGKPGDWTKSRPRIRLLERLHKAHAVTHANADALILGNSRAIVGLDPKHPALPSGTYNLALSAADVYECERYFQHALQFQKPKLLVFAIDKGMFNATSPPEVDFTETRLSVTADGTPQRGWRRADIADTLFSVSAVSDSLLTLAARGPRVTYASGLRDETLMKPYLKTAYVLAENERWKMSSRDFALVDARGQNPQFAAFRAILRKCAEQKIEVVLFTNPIHAMLLEIEYGDGRDFSAWLRQVAAIVAEEAAAQGRDIPLWNFYGYNAITTEPFPDKSQLTSTLVNYWEISHYRKPIGDLMLNRILGKQDAKLDALPDFGRRVTTKSVERELTSIATERARWRQSTASQP